MAQAGTLTEQATLVRRFGEYAAGLRYQALTPIAVLRAKQITLDTLGTALGGCILGVARSTKFPAQEAPVSFTIPITARKTGG